MRSTTFNGNWTRSKLTSPRAKVARRCSLMLLLLASMTGCTAINTMHDNVKYSGSWNNFMVGYRNSAMSASAWHGRKHTFCNEKYLSDFSRGFRDGYEAVANGSDGCTPALCPQRYWSWQYQNAEGQAKAAAWFAGYPHGARAAEEDGIGSWSQIQTSANIQAEYSQAGMMNGQPAGIYPVAAPKQNFGGPATGANNAAVPSAAIPQAMPGYPAQLSMPEYQNNSLQTDNSSIPVSSTPYVPNTVPVNQW